MTRKPVTVLVTGGHLTPAVATMEAIRRLHPDWRIVFVGRSTSLEREGVRSDEEETVRGMDIPFISLETGRFKRYLNAESLRSLLKIPGGFVRSARIVGETDPSVVVSFGGYIAFPIAVCAYLRGIPVVTHEQTAAPGLANRLIARLARHVAVSFPEAKNRLGGGKRVTVTGLPVREGIMDPHKTAAVAVDKSAPLILIAGGSTGSVSMNALVYPILPALLERHTVIHQTGRLSETESAGVRSALPEKLRKRYHPFVSLDTDRFGWALEHCRLFVGRAGANTVTEVAMRGKPAVWIPLPWAASDEQTHNARYLSGRGTSRILDQQTATPDALLNAIRSAESDYPSLSRAAETVAKELPRDGADRLVGLTEAALTS